MWKKLILFFSILLAIGLFAGCQSGESGKSDDLYFYVKTAEDIAKWKSMETPGGGEGSVELGDGVAIIKAAEDGWGGVQSEPVTIDFSRNPMFLVQVKENADEFRWGAKFVPTTPEIEDHEWGLYLIEDNNFKWNNYAGVDMTEKLGQSFIDMYGEKVEGVFWLYAAGSPDATVEITQVKIFYQK